MGIKLVLILGLLTLAVVAESANATWPLTESCVDGQGCIGDDDGLEYLMDSGSNHRQLAARRRSFISYSALKKNNVPCSRRGRSYYDCKKKTRANPYRRGCSIITHCYRSAR